MLYYNRNDSGYKRLLSGGREEAMGAETKYTRKGSAVYAALAATRRHPSAESLYRELRETYPNISRTTVYANLARLREEGSVTCVGVVEGKERFDAVTEPHPHFICEVCGAVMDVDCLPDTRYLDPLAEKACRGRVRHQEIIFRGRCEDCICAPEAGHRV